jgi:ubiquinone/menaquinone biosynthesis C-methylase UbiE
MNPSTSREYFESIVPRYDKERRKKRYYYSLLERWFRYVVPPGKRILELGCADGSLATRLEPSSVAGVDFAPGFVELAKRRHPEGDWREADLTLETPSFPQPFDYVIASDLVGYISDIQETLERLRGVCHQRTRLVLTKANPFWGPLFRIASWVGIAQPRTYQNWLTLKQFRHLVALSEFEIISSGKFCLLPINIPIISTIANRVLAHLPLLNRMCVLEYIICRSKPNSSPVGQPSVSVLIPTRNEKLNIQPALERMPVFPGPLEVIFVEGHSNDGTWDEIQAIQREAWPFTVSGYQQQGKGKGDAVRTGFQQARNDILMILDADLTVPPEELVRFYRILAERRAEYVHGTRLVYPMKKKAMRPLNWIGNKFFSLILSFVIRQDLTDTLCGTKCLWRVDYDELAKNRTYFGNFDPFGDFDLIFGAAKLNLKMEEIPIHYMERRYGETNINRFRDGWLLIRMCWFAARKMLFL